MLNTLDSFQEIDGAVFDYDLLAHQSPDWTEIKAKSAASGLIESYRLAGSISQNPGFYAFFNYANSKRLWQYVEVFTSWQERQEQEKLRKVEPTTPTVKHLRKNRQHERAYIVLHEEQTVTCEDTGISYTVRLPIPTAINDVLNLPVLHPLAFYENVRMLMQQYQRTGLRIEQELEAQVLSGMLLTVLRHRNLLICKDAPRANTFLRAATLNTLGYALRFFYQRTSTLGYPALAMHLEDSARIKDAFKHIELSDAEKATQEAELFILNYIKACKGESTADEAAHIQIKPSKHAKVKVYSDTVVSQTKLAQAGEKQGLVFLAKLVSAYPGQHTLMFDRIKQTLKMLAFASEKVRKDIAARLRETFPSSSDAIELAAIFAAIKQDAIEDDLLSFTQTLKKEIEQHQDNKPKKVDFMSRLGIKG